jgi:hypothetical protein
MTTISMTLEGIVILVLMAFIIGLMIGVSMTRPGMRM